MRARRTKADSTDSPTAPTNELFELCHARRAVKRLEDPPHRTADVCAECGVERLKAHVRNLYAQIYEREREAMKLEDMILTARGV